MLEGLRKQHLLFTLTVMKLDAVWNKRNTFYKILFYIIVYTKGHNNKRMRCIIDRVSFKIIKIGKP